MSSLTVTAVITLPIVLGMSGIGLYWGIRLVADGAHTLITSGASQTGTLGDPIPNLLGGTAMTVIGVLWPMIPLLILKKAFKERKQAQQGSLQ